ncbi:xylulokinase [Propionicicella superfundia]|uniref:xylulokinase n=1 Tax=Propionicicella superfundia TaxID=348582 RepID=UPI0003FC2F37|nr:FGGY family carbohydrate kinase [Propionicicella superfundia]
MTQYLIGIDAGTTGCKACVFDTQGNMLARDYRAYPSYYPHPGYVEQSPDDMVPAVFDTCRAAVEKSGIRPQDVAGLSMSTQGSVIAMMDKHDELIRPFVSWQDIRGGREAIAWILDRIPRSEFYRITGDPLGLLFSVTKYLWLKQNEPENWARTVKLLDQQDYFLRLLGADGYFTDSATASRTGMMDIDEGVWSDRLHDLLGMPLDLRPEILSEPGRVMTRLGSDVAERMGLVAGTPVGMSTFDQNCNTFGSGAVESGAAVMVMGTFGSCFIVSDESIRDPDMTLVVKPNFGMGNYTIEAFSNTCASAYRWYHDVFGDSEQAAAAVSGRNSYDVINDQIASVAPGADGVTFLPYLQGASGAKINDRARGMFLGMRLGTTKPAMARAVMEGVSFEMYDIVRAELAAGIQLDGIRLTGGAANSPLWCQMMADITQRPISVLKSSETGCLGAAMYAGLAVGAYASPHDAAAQAVQLTRTFTPDPTRFDVYQAAHRRFDEAYEALDGKIF